MTCCFCDKTDDITFGVASWLYVKNQFSSFKGLNGYFQNVALRLAHYIVVLGLKGMQSLIGKKSNSCPHNGVREIGQDYDMDGNPLRLIRCQRCGLLMREYLSLI